MAFLFSDGFDWLASTSDITQNWTTGAVNALVTSSNTAFGVGGAVELQGNQLLQKPWGTNENVLFANFRRRQLSGTSATVGGFIQFIETAGAQCTVRWNQDGSIVALSGGVGGTVLGTALGAHNAATWDSWQIKVVIHNTAGSIEVRKNGSTTPILLVTGVNTRAGTTNAYANKVSLGPSTGALNEQFDDFYLWSGSGAAPNDWLGDLRCYTNQPNAATQTQFTPNMTTTTFGQTGTPGGGRSYIANNLLWSKASAGQTGSISQLVFNFSAGVTGHVKAAIYSDNAGAPGTLLATSNEVTNPVTGVNTFTFSSPLSVTRGQTLWVASLQDVTWTSKSASGTTGLGGSTGASYAGGFPASAPAISLGSLPDPYAVLTLTSIPQVSLISDTTQDGDASYIFSSTVGNEDRYTFPNLPINPASIVGVVPFIITRKTDAGAREATLKVKSGATEVSAGSNSALPQTYTRVSGFLASNPETSNPWTTAAVNALEVGVAVTA